MPGLGDEPLSGFSYDETPDVMPDLSRHNSIMADVLKKNPSIYDALKGKRTDLGVTLAQCIKAGMDNKGHPMLKTIGMTAGDEESYEVQSILRSVVCSHRGFLGVSSPLIRCWLSFFLSRGNLLDTPSSVLREARRQSSRRRMESSFMRFWSMCESNVIVEQRKTSV